MTDSRPAMPNSLTGEARAEWQRIVPGLAKAGQLDAVDRGVLIRYCTVWANWVELTDGLQKSGMLIRGRRDGLVRNPLWLLRSDAEAILSDLSKQLGITPNSRVKVEPERPLTFDGASDKITDLRSRRLARAANLD